ncbi:MAG: hypothetical protein Q9213_000226 [Squamulea squamosa]
MIEVQGREIGKTIQSCRKRNRPDCYDIPRSLQYLSSPDITAQCPNINVSVRHVLGISSRSNDSIQLLPRYPYMSSILLVGGNGLLARHITKRFSSKGVTVHSVIRNPNQVSELKALGASPIVQSVEDSSVADFVQLIKNVKPKVVVWSASAGAGSASAARIKRVDAEGHIKVIDAVA